MGNIGSHLDLTSGRQRYQAGKRVSDSTVIAGWADYKRLGNPLVNGDQYPDGVRFDKVNFDIESAHHGIVLNISIRAISFLYCGWCGIRRHASSRNELADMIIRIMKLKMLLLIASAAYLWAQSLRQPNVEFDMMTWAEVRKAIHEERKINAIVYNGGTEQRGPQNVNGGHNLMARETARAIALRLGNAIVAPVMPFSVNEASAELPGTIGLTGSLFAAVNERVAEQLIKSGFKNVFLMGDHAGGQKELGEVAKKLDVQYSPQGIHIFFCDEMYAKAQGDYTRWLADNGYPSGGHASIMDTSEMLYLGGDKGWVRKELLKTAKGDPVAGPGQGPRIHNGITGDARPSTPELGKRIFDMKVDYAVNQIKRFLSTASN